jgi:diguanylate cyclase (GGDEF)-like protein
MGWNLFRGYVTAALSALVVYFLLPSAAFRELAWQLFIWGGVAALVLGVRVHAPGVRGPWRQLTVGLALMALAGTINLPWFPAESLELRRLLGDLMSLVGYPLIGVGTARFARAQSGGRDHGPVLDSVIVTIALTTVLWEGVFAQHGAGGMEPSSLVSLLVVSLSASWVAAMSTRLILAGGHRLPSGWLLFSSGVAGMCGTVAYLWTGGHGRLITGGPVDALWAVAVLLVAASSLHPSMRKLTQPAEGIEVANIWARVVLPAFALATPPAAMLVRQVTTGETAVVASTAAMGVAAVVVLRFADLTRSRERARRDSLHRAERESAIARLGEQGLAHIPMDELLASAAAILGEELGIAGCRLFVREAPPGAVELPGAGGRVWLAADAPIDPSADTAAFASAVGHVLAAAITRREVEDELHYQSLHDPLTGLANRALLDDRMAQALARRRSADGTIAVVFLDLDGFKAVNDTHGHAAGDELLRDVARRLLGVVRPSDTVARFAGDEFVLVLEDVGPEVAVRFVERVLAEIRVAVPVMGHVVGVTASVGLALAGPDAVDADTLLRRADDAMYRAKQRGRDRADLDLDPWVAPIGSPEATRRTARGAPR